MNRIECFKEDCETYSELIDGEAVGMYCCPDCNEWQCNTEECACDHVLEENTNGTVERQTAIDSKDPAAAGRRAAKASGE